MPSTMNEASRLAQIKINKMSEVRISLGRRMCRTRTFVPTVEERVPKDCRTDLIKRPEAVIAPCEFGGQFHVGVDFRHRVHLGGRGGVAGRDRRLHGARHRFGIVFSERITRSGGSRGIKARGAASSPAWRRKGCYFSKANSSPLDQCAKNPPSPHCWKRMVLLVSA